MNQPNYKLGNKTLIGSAILVAIFFLLCLTSCSSRKVSKSKTETKEIATTESTTKDSSKTFTKLESNTKIVDVSQSDELVISPIDNTKEMFVNGKTFFNVKLASKKTSNNIVTDKSINAAKTSQNDIKTSDKTNKIKTAIVEVKNSDKKQFNFLSLWWIPLVLVIIYWLWRKYKNMLPF